MRRIESMAARVVAGTIAFGLAGAALSGCSESDRQDTWRFAISCADESTPEIVSRRDVNLETGMNSGTFIDVSCYGEEGYSAPIGVETISDTAEGQEDFLLLQTTSRGDQMMGLPGQTPEASTTLLPGTDVARIAVTNINGVESNIEIR